MEGCGPGNPRGRKGVSGTVTLDSKPLARGSISFTPQDETRGVQSGGPIANGSYSLSVAGGLPAGKYLVRIFASPPDSESADTDMIRGSGTRKNAIFVDPIPPEYNVESRQFIEVTENGPNQFDFAIKTKTQ